MDIDKIDNFPIKKNDNPPLSSFFPIHDNINIILRFSELIEYYLSNNDAHCDLGTTNINTIKWGKKFHYFVVTQKNDGFSIDLLVFRSL